MPDALRYYDELKRRGEVVFRASPSGENVPFSFDYSFNYYPLTYDRPGPEIVIYRLDAETARHEAPGRCRRSLCGLLAVAVPNLIVWLGGRPPVTSRRGEGPARAGRARAGRAGQARRDAERSCSRDRIAAAAELYKAGRVDKLLLSGDHARVDYDEVGTMRRILLAQGIPARRHLHRPRGLRHVGLRAARQARLRRSTAVVVTQGFHMARALYDARRAGLKATGFSPTGATTARAWPSCACARPPRGSRRWATS